MKSPARRDLLAATAISAALLVLYARTMVPGLGGSGDSAKFQYIGSVLGTPHPPGYPLYIFASFLFSKLPFGTLAHRINFMSAFFGAATSGLLFLVLRQLRAHWIVAVAGALALGFDRFVWNESMVAEVYSLNAALTALTVFLALRWGQSGRDLDLYFTAAAFAASLGNHLTIGAIGPALVAYVWITRPRSVRLVTVAVCSLILIAGLSQYGYIILRTHQQAAHLEAHASNLRELVDVMRAKSYTDEMFIFSPQQLWSVRVPEIVGRFWAEWGPAGFALVVCGIVWLAVRRSTAAVLLLGGAIGVTLLTLNVDADVNGFLLPAFVLCWAVAGVGLMALQTLATARSARLLVTLAAVALPCAQLVANYRVNDHHNRTYESRYMTALFEILPERSAILREAYSVDQLVLYKLVGEHANVGRTVELIDSDQPTVQRYLTKGYTIFAFAERRAALEGFGYVFAPVALNERRADGRVEAIDTSPMEISRLIRSAPCLPVGNSGWRDISGIAQTAPGLLRIDNYRPFLSEAILYVATNAADDSPPSIVSSDGTGTPAEELLTFHTHDNDEARALHQRLASDGVPGSLDLGTEAVVYRLVIHVNDAGQFNRMTLAIPGHTRVAALKVSVDLNNPQRATVCSSNGA